MHIRQQQNKQQIIRRLPPSSHFPYNCILLMTSGGIRTYVKDAHSHVKNTASGGETKQTKDRGSKFFLNKLISEQNSQRIVGVIVVPGEPPPLPFQPHQIWCLVRPRGSNGPKPGCACCAWSYDTGNILIQFSLTLCHI
jgi:hypothetical protein